MTIEELLKYSYDIHIEIDNQDFNMIAQYKSPRNIPQNILKAEVFDYTINDGWLLIRIAIE